MSQINLKSLTRLLMLAWLAATICAGTLPPVQAQEPDGPKVFLPLVIKSNGGTLPPPPAPVKGDFFADTQYKTSSASIQLDAQNGMHLAYYYYEAANDGKPTSGVYYYCATDCDKPANWAGVTMGAEVNEIQLKLTPAGQPRIIYRAASQARANGNDYFYAACDQSCTDPAKWQVIYLTSSSGIGVLDLLRDDELPQRYFALDPAGRPRFVYNDGVTGHLGTFYAFCDAACTDVNNWDETRINKDNGNEFNYRYEKFAYPALTFTPQGQPRIVADGASMQDEYYLYYLTCDGGCVNEINWQSTPLYDRGSGAEVSYDVMTDGQGHPRVAFYQGALLGGQGARLSYAWCNDNCLNGANWQRKELGLASNNGRGPDLELDPAGYPRLAYALYDAGGLGYSWCDSNCESTHAVWQHKVVESRVDLLAKWPVAYPPHCNGGLWDGIAPTMALDRMGNPRIAYDATYHARCIYIPETGEWKPYHIFRLIWHAVRLTYFPQP